MGRTAPCGLAHRLGSGDSWMSVGTTNNFLILGKTYVQTTPGMAPNDFYAISNELQKKVYPNRFSESDFTSLQTWDLVSRFGTRKENVVQFIKELQTEVLIQFLYKMHYNFLPGTETGGKVPTLNGRKITFTEAILINFF